MYILIIENYSSISSNARDTILYRGQPIGLADKKGDSLENTVRIKIMCLGKNNYSGRFETDNSPVVKGKTNKADVIVGLMVVNSAFVTRLRREVRRIPPGGLVALAKHLLANPWAAPWLTIEVEGEGDPTTVRKVPSQTETVRLSRQEGRELAKSLPPLPKTASSKR